MSGASFRPKSDPFQRPSPIRQLAGLEAGKRSESKIEESNQPSSGRREHSPLRYFEFGDQPERVGGSQRLHPIEKRKEFVTGEAVQKEVSDDKVVILVCELERARVSTESSETCRIFRPKTTNPFRHQPEHCRADVDRIDSNLAIALQQTCREASVAVSENERISAGSELRKEIVARTFKVGPEAYVFEPTVGASDTVEVQAMKGRKRSGVNRAASAAIRRVSAETRLRWESSAVSNSELSRHGR